MNKPRNLTGMGVDLMRRINSGELKKLPSEYVDKTKSLISEALSEFLDTGARIRPLIVDNKRVGWCRGVHLSERKILQRWSMDLEEFTNNLLRVGTTLPQDYIDGLSGIEIQSLLRLLKEMSDYDLSLFPYIYAFSTTSMSNRLWCSRGRQVSDFENREISLFDNINMKVLAPPDHARFWATMCKQHDDAVVRIDNSMNAALILRGWVGKGTDSLNVELKNIARSLRFDGLEPWETVIRLDPVINVNDGWAHAEDSLEGLQRELKGMISNDRHERLIETFEKQQREQADSYKEKFNKVVAERGGPGIINEKVEVLTEKEVNERALKLKKGKAPVASRNTRDQGDDPGNPQERIKKYR
jgi:hypothetical protein